MFDMNMYTYLGMCLTMTYLRKYAYTSLGMSFLMGAFAQEWCCLLLQWIPLYHCSALKERFKDVGCPYGNNPEITRFENVQRTVSCTCDDISQLIELNISDFIKGQYGVVAVLISYGALLGKVQTLHNIDQNTRVYQREEKRERARARQTNTDRQTDRSRERERERERETEREREREREKE